MNPRLIVLDLDFTVWFPEMYELDGSPFTKKQGRVYDKSGEEIQFFPDVHDIIKDIGSHPQFAETELAVASKTTYPQWAEKCMELLEIDGSSLKSVVNYSEIYPKNKIVHFSKLKDNCGCSYEEMLFFDNEIWNCQDVEKLGVTCIHTPNGLSRSEFEFGLQQYRKNRG